MWIRNTGLKEPFKYLPTTPDPVNMRLSFVSTYTVFGSKQDKNQFVLCQGDWPGQHNDPLQEEGEQQGGLCL